MTLRIGDIVRHRPTGEEWVVAAVEPDGVHFYAAGWPESLAEVSDTELVRRCGDAAHARMVMAVRSSVGRRAQLAQAHTCDVCSQLVQVSA